MSPQARTAPVPGATDPSVIRNFCIIAHIDHGKSTLADRMLQSTGTVEQRDMRAQYLDNMDIERERGITIKSQAVRMSWTVEDTPHILNMIDTPGHVDFTYEVSRSLAACEGALLLVDAAQGIEAQTLANLYLAMEHDLTIIPVLNKIDLPAADPDRYAAEIANLIGVDADDVLRVSGKTGIGVEELLDKIVREIPPPEGVKDAPARAMIFDSVYDTYRGVVTYVRMVDGSIGPRQKIEMMATGATHELLEVGVSSPTPEPAKGLSVGEVGYLITGAKDVRQSKVGDTVTLAADPAQESLGGYEEPQPMVFSGLYPIDGSDYPVLRDALDKLKLNDAALAYEPETSVALGFGFRVGFLGLLHLEIVRERLEREFNLDLISTAPNVEYEVVTEDKQRIRVTNPSEYPEGKILEVHEPMVNATIITPSEFVGAVMELCQSKRGNMRGMDYLSEERVELRYWIPLAEIVFDFFDQLKSRTKGYASLDWKADGEQVSDLVKVDILLQGEQVDAFSAITHKDKAYSYGVMMTQKLRELIPRQQFEVPIQAAIGSRIIARENIRAIRKDVLAKCYGGDISRKRKLLEKQKEGKKRMKMVGRVEVPQEAFIAALSSDAGSADKGRKSSMPAHDLDGATIPALDGSLPAAALARTPRTFSAYVHIPFCAVRCGYCDFNTYTAHELGGGADLLNYAQTLIGEIELSARRMAEAGLPPRQLASVFFGGGTPTLLPGPDLAAILGALKQTFGVESGAEVTVEANPDTVTPQLLQTLVDAGVNRVSIGMQSAVPHVLKVLDRTHNPHNIPVAVDLARQAGLQVSLDLIYGTPGESVADYRRTLELVTSLEPDHVSAYALIIEEGTKLAAQMKRGLYPYPDPDDQAEKYELTDQLLHEAGYHWYELSNWSTDESTRSAHNRYYWMNQDWWGYGPGAHSHLGNYRFWNVKHPRAYAERLSAGHSPALGMEIPDAQAQLLEDVLLQTRLVEGLHTSVLGVEHNEMLRRCQSLLTNGLIDATKLAQSRVVLTLKGRLLADEVVRQLLDF